MKNQLFLFSLIFALALGACSKKTENNPQPSKSGTPTKDNRLSGFTWTKSTPSGGWLSSSFLDQNTGYISGLAGAVSKTTDGGVTWTALTGLPTVDLYGCFFNSATDGFVVGNYNTAAGSYSAYRTINGGANWTLLSLPASLGSVSFRSVYFYNASIGFIGGGNGKVLKTTDGGATWALSNSGVGSTYAVYSFAFFNSTDGLASGSYGTMFKTTDGGANWTSSALHDSPANLSCVTRVPNTDSAFVTTSIGGSSVGASTTYLHTGNKGTSWTKVIIPGSYQALQSVKIFNLATIYMVGGSVPNNTGVIFSNINFGGWTQETIPASGRLCTASAYEYSSGNGVVFAAGLSNSVIKGQ